MIAAGATAVASERLTIATFSISPDYLLDDNRTVAKADVHLLDDYQIHKYEKSHTFAAERLSPLRCDGENTFHSIIESGR